MMAVLDEINKMQKYDYLLFVEFLDMICRIALVGVGIDDSVEYKVNFLLEILYRKYYERKEMNAVDHPLMPVDEKYRHDLCTWAQ